MTEMGKVTDYTKYKERKRGFDLTGSLNGNFLPNMENGNLAIWGVGQQLSHTWTDEMTWIM